METITKQPIKRDGLIMGFRCYKSGGIFNSETFTGYEWVIQDVSTQDIKHQHNDHFFDSGATRFFNARYPLSGYRKGDKAYFITSEQYNSKSPRLFTIRVMDWTTGKIDNMGEFQQYGTKSQAQTALRKILKG